MRRNFLSVGAPKVYLEAGAAGNFYEFFSGISSFDATLFNGTIRIANGIRFNTWDVYFIHWNQASSFIDINNESRGGVAGTVGNNNSTGSTHAATASGTAPSQIDILEHIVYTAKPSDADIDLIMQRMIAQYGNIF
jgi:TM2 domain-containing membrane protein YozV